MASRLADLAPDAARKNPLFPSEVLPGGKLCHENYGSFMRQQLVATLEPALGHEPRYARLLSRMSSVAELAERDMQAAESGKALSSWLPDARAAYRRELTAGHYMTAVADELAALSRLALSSRPRSLGANAQQRAERKLLESTAAFLNELKRSVRTASIAPLNEEYSAEQARRWNSRGRNGTPQPGQEHVQAAGASLRAGAGLVASDAVGFSLFGTARKTALTRDLTDFDRDHNHFEEDTVAGTLEANASVAGIFGIGANASAEYTTGRYYEGGDAATTLAVANLARNRYPGILGPTVSAGKRRRDMAATAHGVGQAVRKLIGGGGDRPYGALKWASAAKEEKGKNNRSLLRNIAADIELQANSLSRFRSKAAPQSGLAASTGECFPAMPDRIARYRAQGIESAQGEGSGDATQILSAVPEPISVPAMPPQPGKPWLKKPYVAASFAVGANASVGFRPLATATGSAGLRHALDKVRNFLPSAGVSHSFTSNRRSLELERQAPMSVTLAPMAVLDFDKGIEKVDSVVRELHAQAATIHTGSRRAAVVAIDYSHPAFATLRRHEFPGLAAARGHGNAGGAYLATMARLLGDGEIKAVDLMRSLSSRLDTFAQHYVDLISDSHASKEAHRRGDQADLQRLLGAINERHWSGWKNISPTCSTHELEMFTGHTLAQSQVAFTRLKYEATMAKQHLAAQSGGLPADERQMIESECARMDRQILRIDEHVRTLLPPMLPDTASGLGFYTHWGLSARKMKSVSSNFSVTAGLGAAVSAAAGGHGLNLATLRGPEAQVSVNQTLNNVFSHPNLLRTGEFYTLSISVKAGAGMRTVLFAADTALRKGQKEGRFTEEFCKAVRSKLHDDIRMAFDGRSDILAVAGRSAGLVFEMSYARPPPINKEKPVPYLRYLKVFGQTTYDNSVRAPDVLQAAGVPAQLNPGLIDTTTDSNVRCTLNGNNVRHLLLEYLGAAGLKSILQPEGDSATLDFEAARSALLSTRNAALREGWFHANSPVPDIVEKYLRHRESISERKSTPSARVTDPDPANEFDYIDLDGPATRSIEQSEPRLRRFAAGNVSSPFAHGPDVTRRSLLADQASQWSASADRFEGMRERLRAMRTDEQRVDYLTRDPEGQAMLQQAVAVLDAYGAWAAMLRTVLGYPGRANLASIDLLRLKKPREAPATAGGFLHGGHGKPTEHCWL